MRNLASTLPGARDHAVVLAGQFAAGAGNLAFAVVMARLLEPGAFARLAAFLAMYTLGHLFAGSLGAGAALSPDAAGAARGRLWRIGVVVAIPAVLLRVPLGELLGLPAAFVVALALAAPAAAVLASERGRLYGTSRYGTVVTTLVTEPVVRLTAGIALAVAAGATGAAVGVALAGWAALAIVLPMPKALARWLRRDALMPLQPPLGTPGGDRSRWASLSFLLLAVVMAQDLLLANRLLEPTEAARFAVVSTLGGMAVFASATVPYVLLGRSGSEHALRTAMTTAASIGALITLAVLAAAGDLIGLVFGERYADVAGMAVPYVAAMAVFAVGRVLAADLCARGGEKKVVWATGATVILQAAAIVLIADSASDVVFLTLVATCGLMASLVVIHRSVRPALPRFDGPSTTGDLPIEMLTTARPSLPTRVAGFVGSPTAKFVGALTLAGLIVRLTAFRSIWLDEAIAISQAKLDFGQMIELLRFQDVHPPLHQTILWVTIRVFGTGEFAVRAPSMIAGALLIPLLFVVGRDLYDRRTGVIAACLGTVAPFLVWYSQEARMYSLFALFALTAVYGQFRVLRRGRPIDWVIYGAATTLLLWTQYFSIIQIAIQQVIFAVVAWQRWRQREPVRDLIGGWLATMSFVALAVLPMIGILRDQVVAYGNRGAGLTDVPAQAGTSVDASGQGLSAYAIAANIVWAIWGYHSNEAMTLVVALWPLGMLFVLWLLGRGRSTSTTYLLLIAAGSIGAFAVLGTLRRDLFELRYFAGVVPLLIVFGARALSAPRVGRAVRGFAVTLVMATLVAGLVDQQLNGANPRIYDFRGAFVRVSEVAQPGDTVLYAPSYLDPVISYYGSELRARPLDDGRSLPDGRVIVLASFLDKKAVSSGVGTVLSEISSERSLVTRFEERQVRVWVFGA